MINCRYSHTWTFAGDPNYFPYEGMPCDCGQTKYQKPKYCPTCGQKLKKDANLK